MIQPIDIAIDLRRQAAYILQRAAVPEPRSGAVQRAEFGRLGGELRPNDAAASTGGER